MPAMKNLNEKQENVSRRACTNTDSVLSKISIAIYHFLSYSCESVVNSNRTSDE